VTRTGVSAYGRVGVGFERKATFLTQKEVLTAIFISAMCDTYSDADTPIRRYAHQGSPVADPPIRRHADTSAPNADTPTRRYADTFLPL
jgi:hypothetical protein